MLWLILILCLLVFSFGFVLLFGAPYLPTLDAQSRTALELLNLKPGQTMLELGSGDGRMLAAAAAQGVRGIGYEINPILVLYSRWKLRRYSDLVTIRFANFWNSDLPDCDGIYVFLLDKYMDKLHKKVVQDLSNNVKLVSFAFQIPHIKHVTESSGLYLYTFNNKNK